MAPARKSRNTTTPKTKLFRCTGYGDCRMVFTRNEHLARHIRKHTGEKPFKCIVPSCERMFSRFDNMMQHTQTHRTFGHRDRSDHSGHVSDGDGDKEDNNRASSGASLVQTHTTRRKPRLSVETSPTSDRQAPHSGLVSPISMNPPSDWDETETVATAKSDYCASEPASPVFEHTRRLSIADLCNPSRETVHLTWDEFEALEGLARFRKTPLWYGSLHG